MARVDIEVRQKATGSSAISGVGSNLTSLVGKLKVATVAGAAFGTTLKKAFELGKEGASLSQLKQSFDRLNESVFKTPDLLQQLRDASNMTVKDADLMRGVLTMTAGVSDELAAKLGQAAPQLMEFAKAANKLNPALGDTAFMFDSIAKGIKRGSPLILDNLGIVIEIQEANKKWAEENGRTVKSMTAQEKQFALLNEVMRSGYQLMDQVGGSVKALQDPYSQFEVQIGNITDRMKSWLGEALLPAVSVLSGEWGRAIAQQAAGLDLSSEKASVQIKVMGQLAASYWEAEHANGMMRKQMMEGLNPAIMEVATNMVKGSKNVDEFNQKLMDSAGSTGQYNLLLEALSGHYNGTAEEVWALIQAQIKADQVQAILTEQQEHALRVQEDVQEKQKISIGIFEDFARAMRNTLDEAASKKAAEHWERMRDAAEKAREAARELQVAFNQTFTSTLADGSDLLSVSLDQLGTHMVSIGGLTKEQADELDRLQGIYDRNTVALSDYSMGIKGAGLSEEARAKKLEDLQLTLENTAAAMQPYMQATTSMAAVTKTVAFDQQALTTALMNQASQLDVSDKAMAQLAMATGNFSKEEVDAALKVAAMNAKIEELAISISQGMPVGKALQDLNDFRAELEQPYKAYLALDGEDEVRSKLKGIARDLDALDGRHVRSRVDVETHKTTVEDSGSGQKDTSSGDRVDHNTSTPSGNTLTMASGGSVKMSGTYLVGEVGPERVHLPQGAYVESNAELRAGGGDGGMTIQGDIIIQLMGGNNAKEMVDEILEEIGKRTRSNIRSGAGIAGRGF